MQTQPVSELWVRLTEFVLCSCDRGAGYSLFRCSLEDYGSGFDLVGLRDLDLAMPSEYTGINFCESIETIRKKVHG